MGGWGAGGWGGGWGRGVGAESTEEELVRDKVGAKFSFPLDIQDDPEFRISTCSSAQSAFDSWAV